MSNQNSSNPSGVSSGDAASQAARFNNLRRHSADEAVRGTFFWRGFAGVAKTNRPRTVSESPHENQETPETSQRERRISVMSLCPI